MKVRQQNPGKIIFPHATAFTCGQYGVVCSLVFSVTVDASNLAFPRDIISDNIIFQPSPSSTFLYFSYFGSLIIRTRVFCFIAVCRLLQQSGRRSARSLFFSYYPENKYKHKMPLHKFPEGNNIFMSLLY